MPSKSELNFLLPKPGHESRERLEGPPVVAGIGWSPLKSGKLQYADKLYANFEGFGLNETHPLGDRALMVIDNKGKLISQRQTGKLALIDTLILDEKGVVFSQLDQQGIPSNCFEHQLQTQSSKHSPLIPSQVHATKDIPGIYQGDALADWMSQCLDKEVRVVLQQPNKPRQRTEVAPGFDNLRTILRFADSYPYTLLSYTVLDILNQNLQQVDQENLLMLPTNFRMNILLSGNFNEHQAVGKFVRFGDFWTYIKRSKERCPLPARNPNTGEWLTEGYSNTYQQALRNLHDELGIPHQDRVRQTPKGREISKPLLGVDMIPLNQAWVKVGDPIEIYDQAPNLS